MASNLPPYNKVGSGGMCRHGVNGWMTMCIGYLPIDLRWWVVWFIATRGGGTGKDLAEITEIRMHEFEMKSEE